MKNASVNSSKAAKVGDTGTDHDGFPATSIISGSPNVFIDGQPAARVGDTLMMHAKPHCPPHPRTIVTGSSTVMINGKPAAMTGGGISCGGVVIGSGSVNIGDQPPGSVDPNSSTTLAPSMKSASSLQKVAGTPWGKAAAIGDTRFARSLTVPYGTCDVGIRSEPSFSIGRYAAYATAITQSGEEVLSRVAGQALADLPDMVMKVIGRAGILAALAPKKLADGTLYPQEVYTERKSVKTNIRIRIDEQGHVYGYHVDGERVPTRQVRKHGDKFAVTLEEGLTIEWVPNTEDLTGKPILVNPIPDIDYHYIWIYPQADQGKEFNHVYITSIAETTLSDYILVFPPETGLPPLHVVYKDSPRDQPGTVTGNGKDVAWSDGYWLGEAANSGQGQYIPTKIAEALRGREFKRFSDLQAAIWVEVAKDPDLFEQFSVTNQKEIQKGNAPFVMPRYKWKKLDRNVLHHVQQIQYGGEVYNIDNLRVATPRLHWGEIHSKGENNNER